MNDDIDTQPIARIYDSAPALADSNLQAPQPPNIQGMGFLITERHVITCAHVIESALGVPEGSQLEAPESLVELDFPFSASDDTDCFHSFGRVIYWRPTKIDQMPL